MIHLYFFKSLNQYAFEIAQIIIIIISAGPSTCSFSFLISVKVAV